VLKAIHILRLGTAMDRRVFMKLCAASTAFAWTGPGLSASGQPRLYERALLVDDHGQPIRASALPVNQNFIFHYPYAGTPCFLLNLSEPTRRDIKLRTEQGQRYNWPGGVGPENSIVGYSAICAHRLAYPTRQLNFISFRAQAFKGSHASANTIHCCAEHSEYDPARGARVTGGPAKQPLAAILLEYEPASDTLFAVGTLGGELFDDFFNKYHFRLVMDHGDKARDRVAGATVVSELQSFCQQQISC
jgi:arsenite oxidase small subunit